MQRAQVPVLTAGVRAPMTPMRDLEHDPEKHAPHLMRGGNRFSLATNARRLRGDHALGSRLNWPTRL